MTFAMTFEERKEGKIIINALNKNWDADMSVYTSSGALCKPSEVCNHEPAISQMVIQSYGGAENKMMKLSDDEAKQRLSRLAEWRREGDWIIRDFKFENFKRAMEFVNRVADEAEAMDHHPDILIHGWNKLRISVMTHDQGGLTEKDFKLAEQIDKSKNIS